MFNKRRFVGVYVVAVSLALVIACLGHYVAFAEGLRFGSVAFTECAEPYVVASITTLLLGTVFGSLFCYEP